MKFENAGTKDIYFDGVKLNIPEEFDQKVPPIWAQETALAEEVNDHVWLSELKDDPDHYAVFVDAMGGLNYWDGSIVEKEKTYLN